MLGFDEHGGDLLQGMREASRWRWIARVFNPFLGPSGVHKPFPACHCEERSDEAIQPFRQAQGPEPVEGWIATVGKPPSQ
jgi:hypothetical protein